MEVNKKDWCAQTKATWDVLLWQKMDAYQNFNTVYRGSEISHQSEVMIER